MTKTITLKDSHATYAVGKTPTVESIVAEVRQNNEPVLLVEDDKPIAAIIPISDYQRFALWRENEELRRELGDEDFERERAAFLRLKPELLKTHHGLFVAVHNGQVVDSDANSIALALRITEKQIDPVYAQLVSEEPRIADIPSPEVIWHVNRL